MRASDFQETNVTDSCFDLSIIMPVYNAVETVSRSINSFQDLAKELSDIIIASVNFYCEIFNKIISLGISKERVIPNFLL